MDRTIITKLGLGFTSLLSLTRLIFNHQKALLRCLTQLHTNFSSFQLVVYPVTNRSFFAGIIAYNYKVLVR